MDDVRTEQILQLLRIASDRRKRASGETAAFNLLSALHMERCETQTHSRIISFLLNDMGRSNEENAFLRLFLQALNIPEPYLAEQWNVCREKMFDGGRIDFVIESRSFCAIIEMKVDAVDGGSQLNRYAAYGRQRHKPYRVFYLTPDGHEPEEQSAGAVERDKLMCISFEKEIVSWLQNCMRTVKEGDYKYSFLKQYLGAVRQITGRNDEVASVTDLLDCSEMASAAQIVAKSFYEKMEAVTEQFFKTLGSVMEKRANAHTIFYPKAVDIILETFTHNEHTYHVILSPSIYYSEELIVEFGFSEKTEDSYSSYMRLDEAESAFPSVYRKWTDKLESLDDLPRINKSQTTRWFYVEDAQGAKLNFKDHSAQIKLIDEMDFQCNYICGYLVELIIKPLLSR